MRARKKRQQLQALKERAAATWRDLLGLPTPFNYNDGTLVHAAVTDTRWLDTGGIAGMGLGGYHVVWATSCGDVLGVGKLPFAVSKKPVTCMACVGMALRRASRGWMFARYVVP